MRHAVIAAVPHMSGGINEGKLKRWLTFINVVFIVVPGTERQKTIQKTLKNSGLTEAQGIYVTVMDSQEHLLRQCISGMRALELGQGGRFDFLLLLSDKTDFQREHLTVMTDTFADPQIGMVGTTFEYYSVHGHRVASPRHKHEGPYTEGVLLSRKLFDDPYLLVKIDQLEGAGTQQKSGRVFQRIARYTGRPSHMVDLKVPLTVDTEYEAAPAILSLSEEQKHCLHLAQS